jgi:hypothetical protein
MPIVAILGLIAQLLPEVASVIPIIEAMLNGQQPSPADIAALDAVAVALNGRIERLAAAAEA